MPNQIIPVVWEKPLRKSAVNTLDKLNEVIDFINTSDIHEFSFIDGDTGREVVSGTSTQLATLDVFGESVQDGTPTPDNPVEVQVVGPRNLIDYTACVGAGNRDGSDNVISGAASYSDGIITVTQPYASGGIILKGIGAPTIAVGTVFTISALVRCTGNYYVIGYGNYDGGGTSDVRTNISITPNTWTEISRTFTCNATERVGIFLQALASDTSIEIKNLQLEASMQATPYIPYGCIGLLIGNDITPIDLQGHVLASLPDGTRNELRLDSAGRVWIEQKTGHVTIDGTEPSSSLFYSETSHCGAYINASMKNAESLYTVNVLSNTMPATTIAAISGGAIGICLNNVASRVLFRPQDTEWASTTDVANWMVQHPTTIYYPLATPQTIELGTITPPPIPSGSVIKIAASLQPEFDIQWWTESAIPSVINGLKAYVDEQIETVNARIDELHGISRSAIVRPDAVIPVFDPIEKSTVDETETDVEKEN